MKTDDDAFVRVDEVLASLNSANATHGLLYGLINTDARPHRSPDSKWYISPEVTFFIATIRISSIQMSFFSKNSVILKEWPESSYPPWAHGPGYVVSYDIAKAVAKRHKGHLKVSKHRRGLQFCPVREST